jgi:hypothetical protein
VRLIISSRRTPTHFSKLIQCLIRAFGKMYFAWKSDFRNDLCCFFLRHSNSPFIARREIRTDEHEATLTRAFPCAHEKARVGWYGTASRCARIDNASHAEIGLYAEACEQSAATRFAVNERNRCERQCARDQSKDAKRADNTRAGPGRIPHATHGEES